MNCELTLSLIYIILQHVQPKIVQILFRACEFYITFVPCYHICNVILALKVQLLEFHLNVIAQIWYSQPPNKTYVAPCMSTFVDNVRVDLMRFYYRRNYSIYDFIIGLIKL